MEKSKIRVLVLTSIIPTDKISKKKDENDILFVTEDKVNQLNNNIIFNYLFIIPRTNFIFSFLSKKWNSYYSLQKNEYFFSYGRKIFILPQIILPKRSSFRKLYFNFGLFLSKKRLDKIIKELKPTIIHAHNVDNNAFIAKWISKKYKIPYIVTTREAKNIDQIIVNNLKSAKCLISLSKNEEYDNLLHLGIPCKIIPHGIDDTFYIEEVALQNKLENLELKKLKLLTVCRLLPYKHVELIINKLNEIKDKIDFEYRIYGDGPQFIQLKLLIEELGLIDKIVLQGRVSNEEIAQAMRASDLFILMSYPETFGRVFVESMASGTPFIGQEKTGIYGLIEDKKDSFFSTPDDFIKHIQKLNADREYLKKVSIQARKTAEIFKWENVARDLIDIYTLYNK